MMSASDLLAWLRTTKALWGAILAAVVIGTTLLGAARLATEVADVPEHTRDNTRRIDALERKDSLNARELATQHDMIAHDLMDIRRELGGIKCWAKVAAKVPGYTLAGCALR